LTIEWEQVGDSLVVRLAGELDVHTAEGFKREVSRALEKTRVSRLVLNLKKVSFIDSSGLGAILGRYKAMSQRGGRLIIVSPSRPVRPVLKLSGLHGIIPFFSSEGAALAGEGEVAKYR